MTISNPPQKLKIGKDKIRAFTSYSSCNCIWPEVIDFASWLDCGTWFFRGVGSTNWSTLSSFDRYIMKHDDIYKEININKERRVLFLNNILTKFKSRAHHYIKDLPNDKNDDEWFSYIQHYGGPTHFIDVTNSFFIALFFAASSSFNDNLSDDFCVYAYRKILLEKYYYLPKKLNRRIQAQQGGFLRDNTKEASIHTILENIYKISSTENWSELSLGEVSDTVINPENIEDTHKFILIKVCFSCRSRTTILNMLRKMNITYETLFPDLEGVIKGISSNLYRL